MRVGGVTWRFNPPVGVDGVVTEPGVRVSEPGGCDGGVVVTAPGERVAEPGAIVRLGGVAEAPGAVAVPACGVRYEGGSHEAPPDGGVAGVVALGAGVVTVGVVTVGVVTVGVVTVGIVTVGTLMVGTLTVGVVTRADADGAVSVGTGETAPVDGVVGAAGCWRSLSASALPGMVSLSPTRMVILSGGMLFIFWMSETEVPYLLAIFQRESPGWMV